MPIFTCRCGRRYDLTTIPNPEGNSIVPDGMLDEFESGTEVDRLISAIDTTTTELYRCPDCGRVAIFWVRGESKPIFYVEEK